jgi:hypothetical protein
MPLCIGISPSTKPQYSHRAFHHDADTTKWLSQLIFGNKSHVAELERHMHLINLDDKIVFGPNEIPITLRKGRRLSAVPRKVESFRTLDLLHDGGMLRDRVIILLGDSVAERFFDWIGIDRPNKFSVTHVVHQYDNWDCAAVYVAHPNDLRFDPINHGRFTDLMCDALGFYEEGDVSYADACLDSEGRQGYIAAMITDSNDIARIAAEESAMRDDEDDVDSTEWRKQMRRERQALLSHYRRPFYPDSDCSEN